MLCFQPWVFEEKPWYTLVLKLKVKDSLKDGKRIISGGSMGLSLITFWRESETFYTKSSTVCVKDS